MIRRVLKILTLRFTVEDMERLGWRDLALGLVMTWLVGMGRHWDNPRASLLQHLGVGSVVYVFVLALYLYLMTAILLPARRSYRHLLTFISLTAPPAALYALPVERWMALGQAELVNVWFLVCVATWRVAMWSMYLRRWLELRGYLQVCATIVPLSLIVIALSLLNLDHVIMRMMAGLPEDRSANDSSYVILSLLSFFSVFVSPVLIILYLAQAVERWKGRSKRSADAGADGPPSEH